jgi:hypothetical protein
MRWWRVRLYGRFSRRNGSCGLRRLPQSRCLVCCPMMDEISRMGVSAVRRVWSRLPPGAQSVLEDGLSPTDLQSLLLDLVRTRAHRTTPASVRRRWQQDPIRAAISDRPASAGWGQPPPVAAAAAGVQGSRALAGDAAGTCAAVGATDQNRVLSTVRSSEVISDQAEQKPIWRRRTGSCATSSSAIATLDLTSNCSPWFPAPETPGPRAPKQNCSSSTFVSGGKQCPPWSTTKSWLGSRSSTTPGSGRASEILSNPSFRGCTSETLRDARRASATTDPQPSRSSSVPTTAMNQNLEMAASPRGQPLSQPTPRSDV